MIDPVTLQLPVTARDKSTRGRDRQLRPQLCRKPDEPNSSAERSMLDDLVRSRRETVLHPGRVGNLPSPQRAD